MCSRGLNPGLFHRCCAVPGGCTEHHGRLQRSVAPTFCKPPPASQQEEPREDSTGFVRLRLCRWMRSDLRATQLLLVSFKVQNSSLNHTFRLTASSAISLFFKHQPQIRSPETLFSPSHCLLSVAMLCLPPAKAGAEQLLTAT